MAMKINATPTTIGPCHGKFSSGKTEGTSDANRQPTPKVKNPPAQPKRNGGRLPTTGSAILGTMDKGARAPAGPCN
tara:strand:- start:271 stop:498 length:228 start_codon:yes stop_codon:yes gene_type:complete